MHNNGLHSTDAIYTRNDMSVRATKDAITITGRRMSGKGVAALAAACMIILVVVSSGQQMQVAAMSKFCECYQSCYPACREDNNSPVFCKVSCAVRCAAHPGLAAGDGAAVAAALTGGDCKKICLASNLCGMAAAGDAGLDEADAAACEGECVSHGELYAKHV
ncbi:hypothetical protein ACP4OV_009630 [Aristida adscensionis]